MRSTVRQECRFAMPEQVSQVPPSASGAPPVVPPTEPVLDEPRSRHRVWLIVLEFVLLVAITGFGFALRFVGIRWGTGYYLHPDELFLSSVLQRISAPASFAEYLNSATSPLNPFNHDTGYVYGTFPLFLAKFVGSFTDYTAINNNHIPGRWLSAGADTATIVFVWWIGRMLWNRWIGLLAALLMAVTVLNIQSAHFFTTDSWSTMFGTAAFAFALAAWKHQRWSLYALAGLMVGLAGASKPTMLAAAGFLALPALELVRTQGWPALWPHRTPASDEDETTDLPSGKTFPVLFATILAGLVAVWTFRIAQPYTFTGPSLFSFQLDPRWLDDIQFWQLVQSGQVDYPPSHQWTERAPILFHLQNLVLWGMGPALGLAALAGMGWIGWRMFVSRQWPTWTLLMPFGWIAFHIVYFGIALTKTMRYLLPAYPFMVVLAAGLLGALAQWGWRRGSIHVGRIHWSWRPPRWCHPGVVLPMLVVGLTVAYAIAFVSIYERPHSRVAASEWIVDNIPDGSTIVSEYWDSGLPVGIPELAGHSWNSINIAPYDDENLDKLNRMIGVLQQADYVVLSSNRLIDSIDRLPWRYPMANAYYDALLSGELGFEEVAHFTSFPELFGISLDDRGAEEAFTVYDHPEVRIFRKTDNWDPHAAWYLLYDALGHGGLSIRPVQTQPDRMMLDTEGQDAVRSASGWQSLLAPASLVNRLAPLVWYVGLQLFALASTPLAWRLFAWLPDRGYALSKTLGIFLAGWITWWLGSFPAIGFGLPSIVVGWIAILASSGIILWRAGPRFQADIAPRWKWIVSTEVVLLAGFAGALLLRSGNPDLWLPTRVGTQLQDMAAFTAAAFTPGFPVYDPWLVDGTIHDFTFGLIPWAMLTRLTGIDPAIAYSLALGTLAALVLLNAWSLTTLLVHRFIRIRSTWTTLASGLLGSAAFALLGPWGIAQRVATGDWSLDDSGNLIDAVKGAWQGITSSPVMPDGAWWAVATFTGTGALEVPLLSYLTNEFAIQQRALPLLLATLIPSVGFLTRTRSEQVDDARPGDTLGFRQSLWTWVPMLGVVIGWLVAANPLFGAAAFGLTAVMIFLVSASSSAWHHPWAIVRDAITTVLAIGIIATAAIWPFLRMYGTFATLRQPLSQALDVGNLVTLLGTVWVGIVVWLSVRGVMALWPGQDDPADIRLRLPAMVLLPLAVAFAWIVGFPILLVPILVIGGFLLVWQWQEHAPYLVLLAVVLTALALVMFGSLYEFQTWPQQQNIPLQFQLIAWTLLAVLFVLATLYLAYIVRRPRGPLKGVAAGLALVATLVLAAPGLTYPLLAIPQQQSDRLTDDSRSLNATSFMTDGTLDINANGQPVESYPLAPDQAAVAWLRSSITGLPTIVEAPANGGGWGGRISALPGFPTVLGSIPVEMQQRPGMDRLVNWRAEDVRTLYTSTGPLADVEPILQDYGIQLIYVGPLERITYGEAGLAKFDLAVETGELERVYAEDGVSIYYYGAVRNSREPGS